MNSELETKTERLAAMLAAEKLSGVLLNAQHNFAWLTGGGSNGIDLSREAGASCLLVRADGRRFLIANNIEMPRMLAEEISGSDFEPVELKWQDEKASPATVFDIARSLITAGADLATDILPNGNVRQIESLISLCRYQLTSEEIDRFRALGCDAGRALGEVVQKLAPGETENQIAGKVRSSLAACGIFSVVTLVAADERIALFRHPIPTENIWRNSLLIAICARRSGLIASLSRMICAGEIAGERQHRTEATAAINARLCAATRPGTSASALYKIAADAYDNHGFADEIDKHHQGGACGYRTRDWVAHPTNNEIVQKNQAFAWNPSITGTKTEETGIASENGFEILTATDGFPKITHTIDGHEYFSPGILSLSKGVFA